MPERKKQNSRDYCIEWDESTLTCVTSQGAYPFGVPLPKEARWNALHDLGNNAVVAALASTNFNSDKIGVWMITGKIIKNKG